jgi:hypothetical protein
MLARWKTLVLTLLIFFLGQCTMDSVSSEQQNPIFVVIFFAHEQAEIVEQGVMAETTFREQFLDSYDLRGERYHPGQDAIVRGVLLASNGANVVTVPIWAWEAEDGTKRLLCQASENGRPPAFSAFSLSERDLLNQVSRKLGR